MSLTPRASAARGCAQRTHASVSKPLLGGIGYAIVVRTARRDSMENRGGPFAVFADHGFGKKGLGPFGGGSGISGEPGQVMPTF